ncbi:hypothetical protein Droror1_Dr00018714 [Drosera rotundifolia]
MASNNFGSMFLLVIIMMGALSSLSSGTDLSLECQSSLGSVASCISYVTGGTPTVSPLCCSATKQLYSTKEVCLCYLVEQAFTNGSAAGGSIDMQKLLGLPSSCNIQTANPTKCIGLLGLTPSSPGAAVFLSPSPPSTPSSPTPTTSPPAHANRAAFVHQALSMEKLTLLAVAILLCIFPVGFMAQTM